MYKYAHTHSSQLLPQVRNEGEMFAPIWIVNGTAPFPAIGPCSLLKPNLQNREATLLQTCLPPSVPSAQGYTRSHVYTSKIPLERDRVPLNQNQEENINESVCEVKQWEYLPACLLGLV